MTAAVQSRIMIYPIQTKDLQCSMYIHRHLYHLLSFPLGEGVLEDVGKQAHSRQSRAQLEILRKKPCLNKCKCVARENSIHSQS